ncbi:MAG: hypothetical protein ACP5K1_02090 [Candidatus Bathyarchaeia archaeon]
MSLAVECRDEDFRAFRNYLDAKGIRYSYYMREGRDRSTTFHLEVEPIDEAVLQVIRGYVKYKGLRTELEIDHERYNILEWDPKELVERLKDARRRGGLIRGYHY